MGQSERRYGDSNWKDKLTAYGDTPITYDAIGNPLTYRGYTLTWQNGRQLASMRFRTINIGFTYDVDGLRTSKTIPNVGLEHKYYYVGDRLQYETLGGSSALWYFYDADGNPSGIRYKDNSGTVNDYYFVCNWRGDVIQIYNASGTLVGSYSYDAWGKVTENATSADTQNITETNPIRYRGYYYDTETRLYYLKSRYYDPAVKRFLNADKNISGSGSAIQGNNLFEYCNNNPINNSDDDGNWPRWVKKVGNSISKRIKSVAQKISTGIKKARSTFSWTNHVNRVHATSPKYMLNGGPAIGKIGFSVTTTKQDKNPALLHSYSDVGNDCSRYGVGTNAFDWLGVGLGICIQPDDYVVNLYANFQITPWLHGEMSIGTDGIGGSFGVDYKQTSYDFEIKGGWFLLAIFVAPEMVSDIGSKQYAPT